MKAVSTMMMMMMMMFCVLWLCTLGKSLNSETLEQSVRASLKSQMTAKHRILLNMSPEKKSQLNDVIHQAVLEALEKHQDQAGDIDPAQIQQLEAEIRALVPQAAHSTPPESTGASQPAETTSATVSVSSTLTATQKPSLSADELAAIKQQFEEQVNAYQASLADAPESILSPQAKALLQAKLLAKFTELEQDPEFMQQLMQWLESMDITSLSHLSADQKDALTADIYEKLKEYEHDPEFQQKLLHWLGTPIATPAPSTATSALGITAIPSEQRTEQNVEIALLQDDTIDDGSDNDDDNDDTAVKHIVINFSTESLINLWAIVGVILLVNVILYCCYCKNKQGQAFVPNNDDVLQESV